MKKSCYFISQLQNLERERKNEFESKNPEAFNCNIPVVNSWIDHPLPADLYHSLKEIVNQLIYLWSRSLRNAS